MVNERTEGKDVGFWDAECTSLLGDCGLCELLGEDCCCGVGVLEVIPELVHALLVVLVLAVGAELLDLKTEGSSSPIGEATAAVEE